MQRDRRHDELPSSSTDPTRLAHVIVGLAIGCVVVCAFGTACRHSVDETDSSSPPAKLADDHIVAMFADITANAGIQFNHQAGGDRYFVPRSIGSGGALLDVDGDGKLDLYLIQNAGPGSGVKNQLFLQRDGVQFSNISDGSGLDREGFGMGVAVGDINNDDRVDVLVTEYGGVSLMLNQSDSERVKFVDITQAAQLTNPGWATSASFFDYDRDGWLDLVLVNYLDYDPSRRCTDAAGRIDFCGPQSFGPVVARLFHNRGASTNRDEADGKLMAPVFADVTVSAGLASSPGAGLGVLCADFDGDSWQDIFIANDGRPNSLWINQRNGTFADQAVPRGVAYNAVGEAEADMGIAYGDVNSDGTFDIFVTHRATETHTLWLNHANGIFIDQTTLSAVTKTAWRGTGFGTTLSDFDNDGDLDLAMVNGRVLRHSGALPPMSADVDPFWQPYAQRDQLLMNDGKGRFVDQSESNEPFSGSATVSRGLACGDVDNDGKLDLVVTSIDSPARLFRNVHPADHHWLVVRAFDPSLRRDAYGARIELTVAGRVMQRTINPGYSYLTSNDPRAHFGIGVHNQFDNLRVLWPDGTAEDFGSGQSDRFLQVNRGEGDVR